METNGNFHKSQPRNYIEINVFLAVRRSVHIDSEIKKTIQDR